MEFFEDIVYGHFPGISSVSFLPDTNAQAKLALTPRPFSCIIYGKISWKRRFGHQLPFVIELQLHRINTNKHFHIQGNGGECWLFDFNYTLHENVNIEEETEVERENNQQVIVRFQNRISFPIMRHTLPSLQKLLLPSWCGSVVNPDH